MKGLSDAELLKRYAQDHCEEAFRELVARHVDLVYASAMRQLRNPHLAEEATQNAFIALATRAGRLTGHAVLAGWLHRAVHFCARNLQRTETRRRNRENEAAVFHAEAENDQIFQELAMPHVDEALAALSEKERNAVILRFLQQRSLREVGDALGISEDAAKKRVLRGLDRMRALLLRRGVTVSAAVLAAGLSEMPAKAAPLRLVEALATRVVREAAQGWGTGAIGAGTFPMKLAVTLGILLVSGSLVFWWVRNNRQPEGGSTMQINLSSVVVDDQAKAVRFYTDVLGFVIKTDVPAGAERWITLVSPEDPDGPQLALEPLGFPPARVYQEALYRDGVPYTQFAVDDLDAQYTRLKEKGVRFTGEPVNYGPVRLAMLDDTCGNLVQLVQAPNWRGAAPGSSLRIRVTSVLVEDQSRALEFYTGVLGFVLKTDVPAGEGRWLTVVAPDDRDGTELLLEPTGHPSSKVFQKALYDAGIPLTAFATADIQKEYLRLSQQGVKFQQEPARAGSVTVAVFDDTCGNWIQIFQ